MIDEETSKETNGFSGGEFQLELDGPLGKLLATITEMGAHLREFYLNEQKIVEPWGLEQGTEHCAGAIMAPWSNRVNRGRWSYQSQTLELEINEPKNQNANHGLVMGSLFRVLEKTESSIVLGTTIVPSSGYPFTLEIAVKYALTPRGLKVTHSAKSLSKSKAPFGTGAHPYLTLGNLNLHEMVVQLSANTFTTLDNRMIPNGELPTKNSELDLSSGVELSKVELDTDFTDLVRDSSGLAHTYLRSIDEKQIIDVWQDESFNHVVLYKPSNFLTQEGTVAKCLAIEPSTSAPDAFNNGVNLIWLQPGEIFEGAWGIDLFLRTD